MFKKMKFTSMIAFGVAPHAIGKDHPEGVIAGVHSNYYFNYPPQDRWPLNSAFVKKYLDRWKEYPNFQSEGAYTTLMLLKQTIEKANKLTGAGPTMRPSSASWKGRPSPDRRATCTSARTTTRATRTP